MNIKYKFLNINDWYNSFVIIISKYLNLQKMNFNTHRHLEQSVLLGYINIFIKNFQFPTESIKED